MSTPCPVCGDNPVNGGDTRPRDANLVDSLYERAYFARREGTGTAEGDAYHFEQAAAEIHRLSSALALAEKERDLALRESAELKAGKARYLALAAACAWVPPLLARDGGRAGYESTAVNVEQLRRIAKALGALPESSRAREAPAL